MKLNLNSLTYGPVEFKPELPPAFSKLLVPGSHPHYACGKFGNVLLQHLNAGGVHLFHMHCKVHKDLALDTELTGPCLVIHISLLNTNRYAIGPLDGICLRQGQFNIFRTPLPAASYFLEGGQEYSTCSIVYPVSQLEELIPFFPYLCDFIHIKNKPALLFQQHRWMNAQLMVLVNQLLHCPFTGGLQQLYFDYKTRELLLSLLAREDPAATTSKGLDRYTIELLNEAKYIIETGFCEQLTLRGVAKQVGMNVVNLQRGFRQLFGMELSDYLLKTGIQRTQAGLTMAAR